MNLLLLSSAVSVSQSAETVGKLSKNINDYGSTSVGMAFAIWISIALFTVFMLAFLLMFKQFIKNNNKDNTKIVEDIANIAPVLERVCAYLEKVSDKIDNDAKREINIQQSVVVIKSILDSQKIDIIKSLHTASESNNENDNNTVALEDTIKSILSIHRNKSIDCMNEFYINGRQLGTLFPPDDIDKKLEMCIRCLKSRNKQKVITLIEELDRMHHNTYIMMKKRINDIFENLSE